MSRAWTLPLCRINWTRSSWTVGTHTAHTALSEAKPPSFGHRFCPTPLWLLTPQTSLDEVPRQAAVDLTQGLPAAQTARRACTNQRAPGARRGSGCRARRTRCSPQDLGGAGRGHGRHQQGVPQAAARDARLEAGPVPARAGLHAPKVELQPALAGRAALVGLVGPLDLRQLAGGLAGREVDGLEDVLAAARCQLAPTGGGGPVFFKT